MSEKPENPNFIERYLDFFENTEPPTIFNRWSCIAGISALLERQCWIQHGHSKIYPNQYIMLVGESGTRKSTAIKTFLRPILKDAGYKAIAANKTSKEKFLLDLQEGMDKVNDPEDNLDVSRDEASKGSSFSRKGNWTGKSNPTMRELFGVAGSNEPTPCLVMSDDFNVFLGHSNTEFIELLTDLWDFDGVFSSRIKTGKSVLVSNPTLSMLLGNTQVGIAMCFPTEVIGQGFFSRLISVYSDPSGRRITFPKPPDLKEYAALVAILQEIKSTVTGQFDIDALATIALDDIYQNWKDLDDVRFKSYSTRRFTHLLKLCMCVAAACRTKRIDQRIVIYSNSILHFTESFMPRALGEFGKAIHSDTSAKILEILGKAEKPVKIDDLWSELHRDVNTMRELAQILQGLQGAGKIQNIRSGDGFLLNKQQKKFDQPHCKVGLLREFHEMQTKEGL